MNDLSGVMGELERVRSATLAGLETLTQEQLDWRPPTPDGKEEWSLGEVFMHLAIDEIYLRELIARPLLEGRSPPEGVRFIPPPPAYGTAKDVIRFWFERAREETRRLFQDWPEGANLQLTHEGGLEPMNALEWFEGYASHEAFHHTRIGRLIAAQSEPE